MTECDFYLKAVPFEFSKDGYVYYCRTHDCFAPNKNCRSKQAKP